MPAKPTLRQIVERLFNELQLCYDVTTRAWGRDPLEEGPEHDVENAHWATAGFVADTIDATIRHFREVGAVAEAELKAARAAGPERHSLPDTRASHTVVFRLSKPVKRYECPACHHKWEEHADQSVYATFGQYPDGRVGEVFLTADKMGSTASGLLQALGVAVSLGLQYGIPLRVFVEKFRFTRFGASGIAKGMVVSSPLDAVFRYAMKFLGTEEAQHGG